MNETGRNTDALDALFHRLTESRASASSASSCHSDSSEEEATNADPVAEEELDVKRYRSMSDGATCKSPNEDVFPSLPDSVLNKLCLLGPSSNRERLSEEEVEQKFSTLALAFSIDSTTIKDRCDRQRRYRDQTELNLSTELDKLAAKIHRLRPLCVNAETTELLADLLGQVDTAARAVEYATIAAERFGAVQHEDRLSESVSLMIDHVATLKRQRDSTKRQLQYTKQVLQDTNSSETSAKAKAAVLNPTGEAGKRLDRRRASIATITRPQAGVSSPQNTKRVITRRISDLSLRATALLRASRPSRLELGVDLVKIKEGMVENEPPVAEDESERSSRVSNVEETVCKREEPVVPVVEVEEEEVRSLPRHFKKLCKAVEIKYEEWAANGTLHEFFCFGALLCFSFGLITLSNLLIEMELAKRGINAYVWSSWRWTSWEDTAKSRHQTGFLRS